MFVPADRPEFERAIADAVAKTTGGRMLTAKIRDGYLRGVDRIAGAGLAVLAEGGPGARRTRSRPQVFVTDLDAFAAGLPALAEECFGPA